MSLKNFKFVIKLLQIKNSTIVYLISSIILNIFVALVITYNAKFISNIINNFDYIESLLSVKMLIMLIGINILAGVLNYINKYLDDKIRITLSEFIRKEFIEKLSYLLYLF